MTLVHFALCKRPVQEDAPVWMYKMPVTERVSSQILSWLSSHLEEVGTSKVPSKSDFSVPTRPLFVAVNGLQGIGKTTLVASLVNHLTSSHHLSVVSISIDDLYLTNSDQVSLAKKNEGNKLLQFRGNAGTHDLRLGEDLFCSLKHINSQKHDQRHDVLIPSYDKSAHSGRGDRLARPHWHEVDAPVHVVLIEGWMLGFESLSESSLRQRYDSSLPDSYTRLHPHEHISTMNELLKHYEDKWYPNIDVFVHLYSAPQNVFEWRWQQEQELRKSKGVGMSEGEVKEFVERFMVAYELYLPGLVQDGFFHSEKGRRGRYLRLEMDKTRQVVREVMN